MDASALENNFHTKDIYFISFSFGLNTLSCKMSRTDMADISV